MKFLVTLLVAVAAFLQSADAATWYFLRWNSPSASAQFTKFTMQMSIPPLKQKGTYYLWPGLQDRDNTGVYQHVLDGRSGTWWIGAGWCCSNPNLPWGDGYNVAANDRVSISMTRTSSTNWSSTTTLGSRTASNSFALAAKNFNQALLAIELTGVSWDFGALSWSNVVMEMSTTETKWCTSAPENYGRSTKYTMSTPKVSTSGGTTRCEIESVVMTGPA